MKKIYVVTAEYYSAYHIVGVFDDKESAEKLVRGINDGRWWCSENDRNCWGARVETFVLNPNQGEINAGLIPFEVLMGRDGNSSGQRVGKKNPVEVSTSRELPEGIGYKLRKFGEYGNKDLPSRLEATVFARDKQHAVKIANEIRIQLMATNQWPEDPIGEV